MKTNAYLTFAPTISERDAQGLPTKFSGIAYSGGVIPSYGGFGDAAIEIESFQIPTAPVFALVDHDPKQRAGKLSAELQGTQIAISGEFFTSSPAGKEVAALFAEGAPWQLSVGIQAQTTLTGKDPIQMNGRTMAINTLFKNASLREVSFVPVGADPNTAVSAFSLLQEVNPMPSEATTTPPTDPMTTLATLIKELSDKMDTLIVSIKKAESEDTLEDTAEDTAKATDANLSAWKARAETAEAALKSERDATRQRDIAQLAATLSRDFSEAEKSAFLTLDAAVFSTLAGVMTVVKPRQPQHLFQEQATQGAPATGPTLAELNAKLIHQIAGK